jgi:hypothetical protein
MDFSTQFSIITNQFAQRTRSQGVSDRQVQVKLNGLKATCDVVTNLRRGSKASSSKEGKKHENMHFFFRVCVCVSCILLTWAEKRHPPGGIKQ